MRYFFSLFLSCLCVCPCFAHSGKVHAGDMCRVMPFAQVAENKAVLDFYTHVNEYIDKPNGVNTGKPDFVTGNPRLQNMTFGNHRIWFHWGFNKNPRQFQPLCDAVRRNMDKGVITADDAELFWKELMKMIGERNRRIMDEAAVVFGFGPLKTLSSAQRGQLNALVTIIYSIHIIGDHQNTVVDVISPQTAIVGDIMNAIDNLAGRHSAGNQAKARELKKKINACAANPADLLDLLEAEFTPFILSLSGPGYDYGSSFRKLGYVLKRN